VRTQIGGNGSGGDRSRPDFSRKAPRPPHLRAGRVVASVAQTVRLLKRYADTLLAMELNMARYQFSGEGPRLSRFPN